MDYNGNKIASLQCIEVYATVGVCPIGTNRRRGLVILFTEVSRNQDKVKDIYDAVTRHIRRLLLIILKADSIPF